jgi:GTP cyclohydrolase I
VFKIDKEKIEKAIYDLLIAFGDNPDRSGLKETPKRVAKYYMETLEGMTFTNQDIAKMFNKCFDDELENIEKYRDMVIVKDIPCFSFCEHHLALIYNMNITIAYIPKNKVIGLSKLARIADMICKRLQLQEKIGNDIAEIVELITETNNIAIIISAEHSCMTTRGIRKNGTKTITSTLRGDFLKKSDLRNELMILIK